MRDSEEFRGIHISGEGELDLMVHLDCAIRLGDMSSATPLTAVILAAGQGGRLGEHSRDRPKGLLEIGGEALLERSVRLLLGAGIERIFIGTGHLAAQYEERFAGVSAVTCVCNPEYSVKGNAETLYRIREHLEGKDCLLIESDLLYERRAISEVCSHPAKNVLLASSLTGSGDEVFIETDAWGNLVNLSKDRTVLRSIAGELVGITKISGALLSELNGIWETVREAEPTMDYERLLVLATNRHSVVTHLCERLIWCEIDDGQHWRRANDYIYPRLSMDEQPLPTSQAHLRNVYPK